MSSAGEQLKRKAEEAVVSDGDGDDQDPSLDEAVAGHARRTKLVKHGRDCPFIDTVNRKVLDFDFEKQCSVTLVNLNIYVCLVCGKYFQGRARGSPAYTHSLDCGHCIFMNLATTKIYCLPDDYEVVDPSLNDVQYNMRPSYTREQIAGLDERTRTSIAIDGSEYIPGVIGLNDLKMTDGINVVVQSLMRVVPLRNFLMDRDNYSHCNSLLLERFGELARKIWNPTNYKSQVSPHEFVQACSVISKKRFRPGARSDPADFLAWMLNSLQRDLHKANKGAAKKNGRKRRNVVNDCFRGSVHVMTEKISDKKASVSAAAENAGLEETDSKFLFLSIDLPAVPLFKDSQNKLVIPQIDIFTLLEKFDGETSVELRGGLLRRFRLVHPLPRYLIFHYKRFRLNNFFVEKNPTLVTFPVKNLEVKDYVDGEIPAKSNYGTKYNLVSNVTHEGKPDGGQYICHVLNRATDEWYSVQDLHVQEMLAQQVALKETYLQIFERIDLTPAERAQREAEAAAPMET